MKYETPSMEVVEFEGKDVVCSSMPATIPWNYLTHSKA